MIVFLILTKTCDKRLARVHMRQVKSERKYTPLMASAGKYANGAKCGKACNRENL